MGSNPIIRGELNKNKSVLIMIHGRGATAEDILCLANHLPVENFVLIAPQVVGNTWYPHSFMAPQSQNEPFLSNSLEEIDTTVKNVVEKGISFENIFFLGFSQGACLTLEYVTRNAKKWGGIIAFTGGLIGDKLTLENYKGDFSGTEVYIGTSNPDPHVPVNRVKETEQLLRKMNADVIIEIFEQMGHTIIQKELISAGNLLTKSKTNGN